MRMNESVENLALSYRFPACGKFKFLSNVEPCLTVSGQLVTATCSSRVVSLPSLVWLLSINTDTLSSECGMLSLELSRMSNNIVSHLWRRSKVPPGQYNIVWYCPVVQAATIWVPGPVVKLRHHTSLVCVTVTTVGRYGIRPSDFDRPHAVCDVVTALMHYIPYSTCRGVLTITYSLQTAL